MCRERTFLLHDGKAAGCGTWMREKNNANSLTLEDLQDVEIEELSCIELARLY
jgi:hypothetical protein